MLDSFQTQPASQSHVALYSSQELAPQEVRQQDLRQQALPPSERESQVFASPSQVPPGGRDVPLAPAKQRKRRAWAPDADDHLIYRLVKLDGKGQDFVAQCFGIDQSTVSRIVQRYERWQAHAEARDDGRLDPAERLRSQRWLAFEQNEAMLISCLRLAGEMEGCKDVSKSITRYPQSHPTRETNVRTESSVLDRTGMAARFLRLAFRINMEQVKLAEAEPPPLPEPLTEEEVAEQEAQAAEEHAQIQAVRDRAQQEIRATQVSIMDQFEAARYEAAEARREAAAAHEEVDAARQEAEAARQEAAEVRSQTTTDHRPATTIVSDGDDADRRSDAKQHIVMDCRVAPSPREQAPVPEHNMHNLHTPSDAKSGASAEQAGVCVTKVPAEKMWRLPASAAGPGSEGVFDAGDDRSADGVTRPADPPPDSP